MTALKLQSSDGHLYNVDIAAAKQSTTIRTMLEDLGIDDETGDQVTMLQTFLGLFFRLGALSSQGYHAHHFWQYGPLPKYEVFPFIIGTKTMCLSLVNLSSQGKVVEHTLRWKY
jgi:Skp1 family, tetramerisation domain